MRRLRCNTQSLLSVITPFPIIALTKICLAGFKSVVRESYKIQNPKENTEAFDKDE